MPTTDARRPRRASKSFESTEGSGLEVELERLQDAAPVRSPNQHEFTTVAPIAATATPVNDERRRLGAENLLRLLSEKERELQAIGNELDRFQARLRVQESAARTIDESAVRMDVYRELLSRSEAAHQRFEHLRLLVENLDKKIEAGFGEILTYIREERALRSAARSSGLGALVRRSLPALLLTLATALLVIVANLAGN